MRSTFAGDPKIDDLVKMTNTVLDKIKKEIQ